MKVIKPIVITDAILSSSDIVENDATEWTSGGSFALGATCMVTTTANGAGAATHKIYESLTSSNSGNDPTDQVNNADKWLEISATNRWKMFDQRILDQSDRAGGITVQLQPGELVNAIALFEVSCDSIDITVTDGVDGVVYSKSIEMQDDSAVNDWQTYFFEPVIALTELVLFDLPQYGASATIDIVLNVAAGNAKVGEIAIGRQASIGTIEYGASVGIVDYSRKDRDPFGNAIVIEREYSNRMEVDAVIATEAVRGIRNYLASLRATPAVYAGEDGGKYATLVFGYYRDFDIVLANPKYSNCAIQIEGLT